MRTKSVCPRLAARRHGRGSRQGACRGARAPRPPCPPVTARWSSSLQRGAPRASRQLAQTRSGGGSPGSRRSRQSGSSRVRVRPYLLAYLRQMCTLLLTAPAMTGPAQQGVQRLGRGAQPIARTRKRAGSCACMVAAGQLQSSQPSHRPVLSRRLTALAVTWAWTAASSRRMSWRGCALTRGSCLLPLVLGSSRSCRMQLAGGCAASPLLAGFVQAPQQFCMKAALAACIGSRQACRPGAQHSFRTLAYQRQYRQ